MIPMICPRLANGSILSMKILNCSVGHFDCPRSFSPGALPAATAFSMWSPPRTIPALSSLANRSMSSKCGSSCSSAPMCQSLVGIRIPDFGSSYSGEMFIQSTPPRRRPPPPRRVRLAGLAVAQPVELGGHPGQGRGHAPRAGRRWRHQGAQAIHAGADAKRRALEPRHAALRAVDPGRHVVLNPDRRLDAQHGCAPHPSGDDAKRRLDLRRVQVVASRARLGGPRRHDRRQSPAVVVGLLGRRERVRCLERRLRGAPERPEDHLAGAAAGAALRLETKILTALKSATTPSTRIAKRGASVEKSTPRSSFTPSSVPRACAPRYTVSVRPMTAAFFSSLDASVCSTSFTNCETIGASAAATLIASVASITSSTPGDARGPPPARRCAIRSHRSARSRSARAVLRDPRAETPRRARPLCRRGSSPDARAARRDALFVQGNERPVLLRRVGLPGGEHDRRHETAADDDLCYRAPPAVEHVVTACLEDEQRDQRHGAAHGAHEVRLVGPNLFEPRLHRLFPLPFSMFCF